MVECPSVRPSVRLSPCPIQPRRVPPPRVCCWGTGDQEIVEIPIEFCRTWWRLQTQQSMPERKQRTESCKWHKQIIFFSKIFISYSTSAGGPTRRLVCLGQSVSDAILPVSPKAVFTADELNWTELNWPALSWPSYTTRYSSRASASRSWWLQGCSAVLGCKFQILSMFVAVRELHFSSVHFSSSAVNTAWTIFASEKNSLRSTVDTRDVVCTKLIDSNFPTVSSKHAIINWAYNHVL